MDSLNTFKKLQDIFSDPELFSPLDKHFAMFISRLAQKHKPEAALAAALVSSKTGEGNVCLDLGEYAGNPLPLTPRASGLDTFVCPSLPDWKRQLLQSGVVGQGTGNSPLVLDGKDKLYLRRYWQYEEAIFDFIRQRSFSVHKDLNFRRLGSDLQKLFPPLSTGDIDWQQIAAIVAVSRPFCVISGGPGTGKTSTAAKILALLIGQHDDTRQLRILLGAPTGKAASRLQQAIADTGLQQSGLELIQASTLHRMLGYVPNSPYFRHNAENPLKADIIVIDEASMVDLPLLAKLMQSVPACARLILLGDRHQLASVQPGSVLGDICRSDVLSSFSGELCQLISELTGNVVAPIPLSGANTAAPSLQDSFVELVHSYRFSPDSAIARLSMAVQKGDAAGALAILNNSDDGSTAWSEVPAPEELGEKLLGWDGFSQLAALQQAPQPESCFSQLKNFRILCALRRGPFGMERVNSILMQKLSQHLQHKISHHTTYQNGVLQDILPFQPVMVTRNDYNLRLFNGDVGIILPDPENEGSRRVFFREASGLLRHVTPSLLPGHETVFAMTVHKSQGSEFNRVLLILPDQDSPLLTRELLYTAITRAREKVEIWGRKTVFAACVERRIKRTSGLSEAIWGGGS